MLRDWGSPGDRWIRTESGWKRLLDVSNSDTKPVQDTETTPEAGGAAATAERPPRKSYSEQDKADGGSDDGLQGAVARYINLFLVRGV